MFEAVVLEPEQKRLFSQLVEIARSVPRDRRMKFYLLRTNVGAFLDHQPTGTELKVYEGDLEALVEAGLLRESHTSSGTSMFDIRPVGFKYYEHIHSQGIPTEEVEKEVVRYLEGPHFRKRHPEAYSRWEKAERALWSSDSGESFTEIGHNCREAMQFFAADLGEEMGVESVPDPAKTVARIRGVLDEIKVGKSKGVMAYVDALLPLWGTTSDLVQRQEHGAQKEGEDLKWEDARRVVFATAYVMFEVDRVCT